MATKTTHTVFEIDGLFVPATIAGDDGAGQGFEPGVICYWGDAYATREAAERCIDIVEAGGSNPAGVARVSLYTGRRVD